MLGRKKPRSGYLVLALAGCGHIDFDELAIPAASSAMITVDTSGLSSTATDFPLPVFVGKHYGVDPTAGVEVFDEAGDSLPIEIDDDNAWVRITLTPGTTVSLRVQFGAMGPASAVWAPSYEGVWHMSSGSVARDSSIHGRDGVVVGTTTGAGVLGNARALAGTAADYITVSPPAAIPLPQLTVSGWMFVSALPTGGSFAAIVTTEHLDGVNDDYYLGLDSNPWPIGSVWTNIDWAVQYKVLETTGHWVHLVAVYDGIGSLVIYRDNKAAQPTSTTGAAVAATTSTIYIGCDRNNATGSQPAGVPDIDFVNGALDEVRIESVARSADWLGFEDAAMRDQVITYGPPAR